MSEEQDQQTKERVFRDKLRNPVSVEERQRIMGVTADIAKFEVEMASLAAQLAQLRMEQAELEDLRRIRDSIAFYVRGGGYRLERAQGYLDGKQPSDIITHYLMVERSRWIVKLRAWLGRGTW